MRLQKWETNYFDILFIGTVSNDLIDLSCTVEALEKIKGQGKARFTGFGCYFSSENFVKVWKAALIVVMPTQTLSLKVLESNDTRSLAPLWCRNDDFV